MTLDINNISYKNKKTWNLISRGLTAGVFQLETNLGSDWARQIKPENISELSDLIALLRPGALTSGLTAQYSNIKNGIESETLLNDEIIDKILAPTHGILCYQEQLMLIGERVAWAHLPYLERLTKTDLLRSGISKKLSKIILELRKDFIDGCIKNGRSKELANRIFDIIENSGRYSFNSSHAFKYAHYTYKTAYLKANYPLEFYTTYLSYSKHKMRPQIEICRLIDEARMLKINILPPQITVQNDEFAIIDKQIAFGLSHIKNVGINDIRIIKLVYIDNWNKLFHLYFTGNIKLGKLREQAVVSLINSGACDVFGISRKVLIKIFECLKQLSKKEIEYVSGNLLGCESIYELPKLLEYCIQHVCIKRRKELVKSEIQHLELDEQDSFTWKANQEKNLLGLSLTCSAIDDTNAKSKVTCAECRTVDENKNIRATIAAEIIEFKKIKTKKGQNPGQYMAILTCRDVTGPIRLALFPKEYEIYKDTLFENQICEIYIQGTGNNNWCIKQIYQV